MKEKPLINTSDLTGIIRRFLVFFLDALFPIECLGCKKTLADCYLCPPCFKSIKIKSDWRCAFCSVVTPGGATCPLCRRHHWLDNLWVAADYHQNIVKAAILAFKYRFASDLKKPLGKILVRFLREKNKDKFIRTYREQILLVPVPLHRRRLNWRSYNQAELLAQELAEKFRLHLSTGDLRRVKSGRPQAKIENAGQRAANVRESFRCQPDAGLKNKTVLLIDDVATSGSTLDECARILKEAGAERVIGLVIAKG